MNGGVMATIGRVLSQWLLGEVVYIVLPLLVLAAITVFLGESFDDFLQSRDWSFAAVVFFGVALGKFVELKRSTSNRDANGALAAGIRLFGLGLIGSVTVLILAILEEKHVFATQTIQHLPTAQLTLFVTGLLSLLVCVCAEDIDPNGPGGTGDSKAATKRNGKQGTLNDRPALENA